MTTKQQLSLLLLGKVLAGRQQQLELKVQKNREAQEESLRRREELIQELELERKIRLQETEQEEGRRTARMQEINAQVSTYCSGLCRVSNSDATIAAYLCRFET